ncbi:protein ORGAN SIZE RELATED 1 [Brassica rapa]|uniref:protein ORGAN SIZE RELATED 1-like n=1 Tax=Brassica napus TaxID=3708 RepID=UPI0004F1C611|nr:protein ORGAN SIZE RELATED 1-like [Brassica napus]XP_033148449.1 protein ORGAN SIZE RELATED 1 [Brassica rapa]
MMVHNQRLRVDITPKPMGLTGSSLITARSVAVLLFVSLLLLILPPFLPPLPPPPATLLLLPLLLMILLIFLAFSPSNEPSLSVEPLDP